MSNKMSNDERKILNFMKENLDINIYKEGTILLSRKNPVWKLIQDKLNLQISPITIFFLI